jgi:hypothetical protein
VIALMALAARVGSCRISQLSITATFRPGRHQLAVASDG